MHAEESVDAVALARQMVKLHQSSGFEARMQVEVNDADKRMHLPFKVAVIGEITLEKQRLLLRGISPRKVREQTFAILATADAPARVIKSTQDKHSAADPYSPLFDSGLILWDLLAPWWGWAEQSVIGSDTFDDHPCSLIRSRTSQTENPISEVISCVDTTTALAWRTQLFDKQHTLLRTITVNLAMRSESGMLVARALTVEVPGISNTIITVYAGDEHYQIKPDTFSILESAPEAEQ